MVVRSFVSVFHKTVFSCFMNVLKTLNKYSAHIGQFRAKIGLFRPKIALFRGILDLF